MPLELVTIPCLADNYAYIVHDEISGQTAVIDVPDAAPVLGALQAREWHLTDILITHHHADHIQGVANLKAATGARVIGNVADAHRLPPLDLAVSEGEIFLIGKETVQIIDVPGHTIGHIAFHIPASKLCFTADSLMAMGCGRLFEGTPAVAYASLMKLAALPPDTLICSGHEYTAANARFATTLEPDNPALIFRIEQITAARQKGHPTVPAPLSDELVTNPYLRAHLAQMKIAVGLPNATDEQVFAEIRHRKDRF